MDNKPQALTEAMSNLIAQHPFFATYLFSQMKVEYDPTCRTAATDGVVIKVGDWFCQLPIRQRVFTLAHEILHGVLDHMPRAKMYHDRGFGMDLKPFSDDRANKAMDAVINAVLVEGKVGDMPPGGIFRSRCDADKTWDEVYPEMEDEQDPNGRGGQGRGEGQDDHLPAYQNGPTPAEQKQAVAQARNAAKAAGKLPGALERLVGEILEPKQNWKEVLRDFVTRASGRDEATWRKLNRRRLVLPPGIPMPGRDGFQFNCAVVSIDTSGSISQDVLTAFISEVVAIAADVRPRELWVLWWDTEAKAVQIEEPEDLETQRPYGGGGTNWDCVPKKIQELDLEPDVVITLTDGMVSTSYREAPWPHLTVTTGVDFPFGTNIHYEG